MSQVSIATLIADEKIGIEATVKGWVRTFRSNRFVALNDGSTIKNLQCVIDFEQFSEAEIKRISTGACLSLTGEIVASQGRGQSIEMNVSGLEVLGDSNPDEFPIQPKKHSLEFLRENAHLRFRTSTFSAVFRIRHAVSFAIHQYF